MSPTMEEMAGRVLLLLLLADVPFANAAAPALNNTPFASAAAAASHSNVFKRTNGFKSKATMEEMGVGPMQPVVNRSWGGGWEGGEGWERRRWQQQQQQQHHHKLHQPQQCALPAFPTIPSQQHSSRRCRCRRSGGAAQRPWLTTMACREEGRGTLVIHRVRDSDVLLLSKKPRMVMRHASAAGRRCRHPKHTHQNFQTNGTEKQPKSQNQFF
jgi:hypothetical protein